MEFLEFQRGNKHIKMEKRGFEEQSDSNKPSSRGHWRPAENAKLKELVSHFGPQNWNMIAEMLGGRSGKSCRLRWYNQLDPKINRSTISEEEEVRLLAAHSLYGNKWATISRLFHGRTDNSLKNHYHVAMARKYREKNNIPFSRIEGGFNFGSNSSISSSNSDRRCCLGYDGFGGGYHSGSGESDLNQVNDAFSSTESNYNNEVRGRDGSEKIQFIDFLGVGAT